MATTFHLTSRTDQPLSVYFYMLGKEYMTDLPPRGRTSFEADHLSYHSQLALESGQFVIDGGAPSPIPVGQAAVGQAIVWAGDWQSGRKYLRGYVVAHGGQTWLALSDHTAVTAPSGDLSRWKAFSVISTSVLYGVDLTTMTDGQLIYRDSGAAGGFSAGKVTDLQVDTISISKVANLSTSLSAKLSLTGGTMSGALTLAGAPTNTNHAATKGYADGKLSLAGGTMSGALTLSGNPTQAMHAATKEYVDGLNGAGYLSRAGGTMTGHITLYAAPTATLHPATKGYADSKLSLSGGTLTGALTLVGAPTETNHAATKGYADSKLSLSGGSMTGNLTVLTPTQSMHPATKGYVDSGLSAGRQFDAIVSVPVGAVPSQPNDLVPLSYLLGALGNPLMKSGGSMTGALTLVGAPTSTLHAATKGYVDAQDALLLPKGGGVMTGAITGSHGLLPLSAGAGNQLTGELVTMSVTDLPASARVGLVYSTVDDVPAFKGRTIPTQGRHYTTSSDYQVTPGDAVVSADSSSQSIVIRLDVATAYPRSPITIRKLGASQYAPVHVRLPSADGRDSYLTLVLNQEAITLLPTGGEWVILGRTSHSPAQTVVKKQGQSTISSTVEEVTLNLKQWQQAVVAFSSITDEGGGLIGFDIGAGASLFQPGNQFVVYNTASAYVGDYVVDSVDGSVVKAQGTFTTDESGRLSALITPAVTDARAFNLRLTSSPSSPWTAIGDASFTITQGEEVHLGNGTNRVIRTLGGTMKVRVTNAGATGRTVYLHALSAGEPHGSVNGGYASTVSNAVRYSANLSGTDSNGGNARFTVPHSHGFKVGDVLTISGTSAYNGSATVTAVTTSQVTVNKAFTGTETSGTLTSADSVSLSVLDPDGFTADDYITVEGVTALGSARLVVQVLGVISSGNILVVRNATYNSSLTKTGLVSLLAVAAVTLP